MAAEEDDRTAETAGRRRGRPRKTVGTRRTHRVVTFVTDVERTQLERLALQSDRSMSFIVYRMIARQLDQVPLGRAGPKHAGPDATSQHEHPDEKGAGEQP